VFLPDMMMQRHLLNQFLKMQKFLIEEVKIRTYMIGNFGRKDDKEGTHMIG
jgi:hypothetical protein